MNSLPRRTFVAALSLAALTGSPAVLAQSDWPAARPITWVVPYPPGGTTDILGRAIALRLGKAIGATVIVDNKPGATGTIGSAFVARAAPDGYTLLGTSIGPQAILPNLQPTMPYDAVKAFEPVTLIGNIPHLLVVGTMQPFKTVADLLAGAKADSLSFASGGNGTILQMQGELLRSMSGTRMLHVPYKGDTPAIQDVLGRERFDEMIISTQSRRVSRWLRLDLPSRARGLGLPVTHIEAGEVAEELPREALAGRAA